MHEATDGKLMCVAQWIETGNRPKMPSIENREDIQEIRREADSSIDNDELVIYTDGACYLNGKEDAQAAIGVWFGVGHPLNVSQVVPLTQKQSNNTAEIQAAIEAVAQARVMGGKKRICIKSDSEILVNAWNKSVPYWQVNGWKTSRGKPVKHRKEFITLINEVAKTPGARLRMEYVPGHKDNFGNIGADALASMAIHRLADKTNHENSLLNPNAKKIVYHKSIFGGEKCRTPLSEEKKKAIEYSCQLVKEKLEKQEKSDELKQFAEGVSSDYVRAREFVHRMTTSHILPTKQYNELVRQVFLDAREKRRADETSPSKRDLPTGSSRESKQPSTSRTYIASEVHVPNKKAKKDDSPPARDSHTPPLPPPKRQERSYTPPLPPPRSYTPPLPPPRK